MALKTVAQAITIHIDELISSSTSYLLALVATITFEDMASLLGVLLLVVRLAYDTIRLVRYARKGKNEDVKSD